MEKTRQALVRGRIGLVLAGILFVGIAVGVALLARKLVTDAQWTARSHEVINQLDSLDAELSGTESDQRGYLLTGNPGYLVDYRMGRAAIPSGLDRLDALVADNPTQRNAARQYRLIVGTRLVQMERTLREYDTSGLNAALGSIANGVFDTSTQVRQAKIRMSDEERALLATRADSSRRSADAVLALAMLGIPMGLLVLLLVYRMLVQEMRRRGNAEAKTASANARMQASIERLETNSTQLRSLTQFGSMLQSCTRPEEAIELTRKMLHQLVPEAGGTLYRMRHSMDHAEAMLDWGTQAAPSQANIAPDMCWALRRGQSHAVHNDGGARCAHVLPGHDPNAGSVCVPLSAQGVQLGLLYLSAPGDSFLAQRPIIDAVAEQLSMALSNLYLQERLRLQSIREPLTGLFNRRYLEESAERELARCKRRAMPLSLLMLDIDHFKPFNDVHGHGGGDALLAGFGALLQRISRTEDIACRYGGEEFTLIMPEAGEDVAVRQAERIRAAVEELHVAHLGHELPKVTVSIGTATYPRDGDTPQALLRAADEALYRAKRSGRNRLETPSPSPVPGGEAVSPPPPRSAN